MKPIIAPSILSADFGYLAKDIEMVNRSEAELDNGMTVNEVKEVLVQMYAYCGFPRSLNGINTLIAVLDETPKPTASARASSAG